MTKVLIIGRNDVHTKRIGDTLGAKYQVQTLEINQFSAEQFEAELTSDISLFVVLGISGELSELCKLTKRPVVAFSMGYDLNENQISQQLCETLSHCSGIVVDCSLHYELMLKIGIPKSKIHLIPYGCDHQFFNKNSPNFSNVTILLINSGNSINH